MPTSSSCRTGCSRRPTAGPCRRTCSWSRAGPPTATTRTTRCPASPTSISRRNSERFEYGEDPIYAWTDITWLLGSRGRLVGLLRRSRDLFVPTVSRPGDRRCRRVDHGDEEPPARVHGPARDGPAGPHPRLRQLRASRRSRDAPVGLVGRAGRRRERASAVEPRRRRRHGARHPARERGDARPGLGQLRDLHHLGRLGRLLRPREPAARRRERVRVAGARAPGQPLRPPRVHRSPDAHVRCLPEADRGPVPGRSAPGSGDRREAGLAPPRARDALDPGRPRPGVRLRPAAAAADDPRPDAR